jgi:hypothetical protein
MNERFWSHVDKIRLTGVTFGACHRQIAAGLRLPGAYWEKLAMAMQAWGGLLFDG